MTTDKVHLRHCILYEFQQGRNATQACRNLLKVFGEGTISDRTCRRWFEKFERGNFDLFDKPRSGRPSLIDDDVVNTMLEQNPFLTTSEIAKRLNSAQQTISDHIRKVGLVWKYSRWMPLELSQKSLDDTVSCFTTCDFIRQLSCNGGDAHNRDSQPDSGDGEDQNHTRQIKQEIEDDVTSAGQDFFGKNYEIEKKVKHETDLDDASSTEFESNLKDRWCVSTRFGFGKNDDISVEEKEKVNLGVSGKLADDTNIFRGVLTKYNEPLKAKKPIFRLRLYPFKNNESLSVSHIHRESVCLIATDRKIADLPISHPICSTQHPVFQYRSVPFGRIYGTEPRLVPPYTINLGSSNGTFLNGSKNEPQRHVKLVNKDVLKSEFSKQEFVMFNKKLADGVNASDSQPCSPASD